MSFSAEQSSLADVQALYMEESCHALALKLHELYGFPLAILYDAADVQRWGEDEIPLIAHVFCSFPPKKGFIIDAKGVRPMAEVLGDFFDLGQPSIDWHVSREELLDLCGDSDEKPLYGYTQTESEEAGKAIVTLGLEAVIDKEQRAAPPVSFE